MIDLYHRHAFCIKSSNLTTDYKNWSGRITKTEVTDFSLTLINLLRRKWTHPLYWDCSPVLWIIVGDYKNLDPKTYKTKTYPL